MSTPPRVAVLTRPAGRNEALAGRLNDAGWSVCMLPALEIQPLDVATTDLPRPADFDMVVFVSGNAGKQYLDQLARADGPSVWPAGTIAATVGPASAGGLRESPGFGANTTVLHPGEDAPSHDSEALWQVLCGLPQLPARVLLVRGTQGRDWLGDRLEAHGAAVTRHAAYLRRPASWDAAQLAPLRRWADAGVSATWLITSGEGADAVRAGLDAAGLASWWERCRFVLTHPSLARRVPAGCHGDAPPAMVKICLPNDESIFQAFVAA
ncbi:MULTISPECIES: uroporphyrinogen-III synthase [Achromobacter]|uniref:uroporphyrinogen-III synthase n=1 Tax=Achromobacter TaxID=222 RepID=UPI000CFDABA0|nr:MULTISPECIES: uroporphyrinogen-III synthase [Achromobacter]MDR6602426.1 uroporphyrinogen-III synthase [Achromobacter deleyi]PQZ71487.1 uroporphyrinogen-III synthase [Achromobacter sp. MYb9]HCW19898.1 uroporphyrinogen-III synthase [Achromobacter sp.]